MLVVEFVEEGLFEPCLEAWHGGSEVFEFGGESASVEGVGEFEEDGLLFHGEAVFGVPLDAAVGESRLKF